VLFGCDTSTHRGQAPATINAVGARPLWAKGLLRIEETSISPSLLVGCRVAELSQVTVLQLFVLAVKFHLVHQALPV
jgi:hypothetical protein